MEHDVTSLWADIKKYEETLAKDPGSYCFAPLAEIYRKMGLLDDAIQVAKKGCDLHPDYVGGYLALGRAYFEKGLKSESKEMLEKVVAFTPDNLMALKLLSQIYVENGQNYAAEKTLRAILAQHPADNESQVLLDSLKTSSSREFQVSSAPLRDHDEGEIPGPTAQPEEFSPDDEEIIEDAELVEELTEEESPEEDDFIFTPPGEALSEAAKDLPAAESDPLMTPTMAELYVSQGFLKRALTIYRELLGTDPDNAEWKNRLYELKTAIDEDTATARNSAAADAAAEAETVAVSGQPEQFSPGDGTVSPVAGGDAALATLEKWLDTIKRRR